MYIADNNVYGVDLNPVAVELAEVSLWLNTIYEGAFVPWFGMQLVCGNSLIGARKRQPKRFYDHLWMKASAEFRYGKMCAQCNLLHRITPAECTDHIFPHRGNRDLFWNMDNWQALCWKCHGLKSKDE